jgi:hypothetical protein
MDHVACSPWCSGLRSASGSAQVPISQGTFVKESGMVRLLIRFQLNLEADRVLAESLGLRDGLGVKPIALAFLKYQRSSPTRAKKVVPARRELL